VMNNEGGYANSPADVGGETYKGISRRYWPAWGGWKNVDSAKISMDPQPAYGTAAYYNYASRLNGILAQQTVLQQAVLDYYKKNFWDKYRVADIKDKAVATWLYDHVVNGGGKGAMWMQEAAGVTADGAVGPKTIQAINAADPPTLLRTAKNVAAAYRLDKAVANPEKILFLPSWLGRDGVSNELIKQIVEAARNGLTAAEANGFKEAIRCESPIPAPMPMPEPMTSQIPASVLEPVPAHGPVSIPVPAPESKPMPSLRLNLPREE
jgi:Glycosyl hydrolase 108/Predicted Peptidoglycan domain